MVTSIFSIALWLSLQVQCRSNQICYHLQNLCILVFPDKCLHNIIWISSWYLHRASSYDDDDSWNIEPHGIPIWQHKVF